MKNNQLKKMRKQNKMLENKNSDRRHHLQLTRKV